MKDLVDNFLGYFFFFSVYLLGSGSIWTFLGSWIRIRIKTYADSKHWDKVVATSGIEDEVVATLGIEDEVVTT